MESGNICQLPPTTWVIGLLGTRGRLNIFELTFTREINGTRKSSRHAEKKPRDRNRPDRGTVCRENIVVAVLRRCHRETVHILALDTSISLQQLEIQYALETRYTANGRADQKDQ